MKNQNGTSASLPQPTPEALPPRFQLEPKACGFRNGIDPLKLNRFLDEVALEDFQKKSAAEPPQDFS
jgi:hypothetical protein